MGAGTEWKMAGCNFKQSGQERSTSKVTFELKMEEVELAQEMYEESFWEMGKISQSP